MDDRGPVLADLDAGLTIRAVAAKHGIPVSTVGRWAKAPRDNGTPGSETGQKRPKNVSGGSHNRKTLEGSRARPAVKGSSTGVPPRVSVETIGPVLRSNLRRSIVGVTAWMARLGDIAGGKEPEAPVVDPITGEPIEAPGPDMQQFAHAARGVDILLARLPDLLSFDERTTATDAHTDATVDDLAGSMGVDLAAPPKLRVVGTRVAEE